MRMFWCIGIQLQGERALRANRKPVHVSMRGNDSESTSESENESDSKKVSNEEKARGREREGDG